VSSKIPPSYFVFEYEILCGKEVNAHYLEYQNKSHFHYSSFLCTFTLVGVSIENRKIPKTIFVMSDYLSYFPNFVAPIVKALIGGSLHCPHTT
jgi:hypothetical protein